MRADDLSIKDIGSRFRSLVYPSKNKTAKPRAYWDPESGRYRAGERSWMMTQLWAHENGNIVINNEIYLRPDTEVTRLAWDDDQQKWKAEND